MKLFPFLGFCSLPEMSLLLAGGVNRFHLNGRNPFGTFQEVFTLNFSASLLEIAESKRHGFGSSGSM